MLVAKSSIVGMDSYMFRCMFGAPVKKSVVAHIRTSV